MRLRSIAALSLALAALFCVESRASDWETDFAGASADAKKSSRYLLLDFSGSDWCGWCVKLEKEVFSTPDFKEFARQELVCVLADFPRKKRLTSKLMEQNADLAEKYRVHGYPTVILLSPEGDLVGKTGYRMGGAKSYVDHLKEMIASYKERHRTKE
jgi:thioredoxin-related protein